MPIKHETNYESLLQRAFTLQYSDKKMKKYVNIYICILSDVYLNIIIIHLYIRLEKEYTVIRKEEQEEQLEIRVCTLDLLPFFLIHITFNFIYRNYEVKIVY